MVLPGRGMRRQSPTCVIARLLRRRALLLLLLRRLLLLRQMRSGALGVVA